MFRAALLHWLLLAAPGDADAADVIEATGEPDLGHDAEAETLGDPGPGSSLGHDAAAPASLRVHVVWDAPAKCPSEDEVQSLLAGRLANRPDLPIEVTGLDEADRWAIARVRKAGKRWGLRIWMQTPQGLRDRTLEAPNCRALSEVAATIVAMTLAGEFERSEAPTAETPAEPPRSDADLEADLDRALADILAFQEPEPEPPPAIPEPPEPEDPPPPRGALRLEGGVGYGALPDIDGGASLAGGVVWRYARIELRGSYWRGGQKRVPGIEGAFARFTLVSATVRGCGVPRPGRRWELPLCVGVESGGVLGTIEGARFLHGPAQPWVAVHLASMIIFAPTPRLGIVVGLEPWLAALPARHRAITGDVHASSRVGFRGQLGLEVRFGRSE